MPPDPLRILILEDVPMDAELVEYELGRASVTFDARRVDTRDAFVAQLDDFQPDVILSDYTLPRFDGMAALALARERVPDVPFLIVTGSVNEETAVGCMKAGATDYLLKSNLARIGPAIEGALARVRSRSEKARAEEALRRSEANLRAIFNHSLQAFVLVDRDGRIQALNRTAEHWGARVLGRRIGEGERIEAFIPDAAAAFHDALAGEARTVERCIGDKDGVERWFETTHAPVVDERGQVIGVCLNARDVSERRRAEQALRESEARYRDLFDNASDLVCTTSPEGDFLYVNRAWHDVIGFTDADLAGRRLLDVVHHTCRENYRELQARALAGETVTHAELTLVTVEGAPVTVEGNVSATFRDGVPVMLRGIYRDITERKRIEDQLRRAERLQAAGQLAGGVAHEVNNMMTGVIGFSEFLLRDLEPDDPRQAEVREIIKAGSRAADITRQLLAFTRQQFLRPEVLDVNAVVTGMEKLLRRSLGEEHQLELRLDREIGDIRADQGQLEQVLLNLVLNARDAMAKGGLVTITTAPTGRAEVPTSRDDDLEVPAEQYVQLSVSDTGCGMSPEVQARIFEPFFTTKQVGQGTGLGLSTVYGIVKQSDGFVFADSEVGVGTTFRVYLPLVAERQPDAVHPEATAALRGGSETILVVEDEEMVRTLACRGLREQGYTVLEARHGGEALRHLAEAMRRIDLVISDVVMPEVGGRELGQHLARIEPELPVLYMSGYTGDDVIQRGLLDPGAPFQQKPFTPETLARKVRELLDRRAVAGRRDGGTAGRR
ncbi:MAG: PAS domain S-box protein [Gemmatimonadales bacterium]|nr:PAS domain S-box protein [Gemmatimonadales bacterium]